MEEPTIRLEGLQKTIRPGLMRRPIPVLAGLTLHVRRGEVYALAGKGGAGKTTVLRVLIGLNHADQGDAMILGLPGSHRDARRRTGYLPQSPRYDLGLTVRGFLRFAGGLSDIPDVDVTVDRAIERFGLTHLRDRRLRRLRRDELQWIGIAQASLHDPPVMILDEPWGGMGPDDRAAAGSWIQEMREQGKSVLLTTPALAEVEALADRVGILQGGRIATEGTAEEILGPAEEEVEVTFTIAGTPSEATRGISAALEERGGLWRATLAGGQEIQVSAFLSRILSHAGTIRSVARRRRPLEESAGPGASRAVAVWEPAAQASAAVGDGGHRGTGHGTGGRRRAEMDS